QLAGGRIPGDVPAGAPEGVAAVRDRPGAPGAGSDGGGGGGLPAGGARGDARAAGWRRGDDAVRLGPRGDDDDGAVAASGLVRPGRVGGLPERAGHPRKAAQQVLPAEGGADRPHVVPERGVEESSPVELAAPRGGMVLPHRLPPVPLELLPDGLIARL